MTWVKICGTTSLHDAELSIDAGADALGFIFAHSARRVDAVQAAEIIAALPVAIEKIGVFVNEAPARVAEIAAQAGLTGVQLHGDEPPAQMYEFRQAVGARRIIKGLQAKTLSSDAVNSYLESRDSLDAILLDSGSPNQRGGTGAPFDWQATASCASMISKAMPLIVSGGLRHDNVAEAVHFFAPWGVDVVSGVEREPGKIIALVEADRAADRRHAERIAIAANVRHHAGDEMAGLGGGVRSGSRGSPPAARPR